MRFLFVHIAILLSIPTGLQAQAIPTEQVRTLKYPRLMGVSSSFYLANGSTPKHFSQDYWGLGIGLGTGLRLKENLGLLTEVKHLRLKHQESQASRRLTGWGVNMNYPF